MIDGEHCRIQEKINKHGEKGDNLQDKTANNSLF